MNYFEFYTIAESFSVDDAAVKRKFYEYSRKYHPDFYISESPEKQQEILELSTLNNRAFQVLSSAPKRLDYILRSHGLISEGEKYQLPQEFLMEMMDVNEALMELEFDADPEALASAGEQVSGIGQELETELLILTNQYDRVDSTDEKESLLLKIKDIYYRQKYLLRIRESLNRFASR